MQSLVPGAHLLLQLDEPSLPAVLEGTLPTASGYGRVRAVEPVTVIAGLRTALAAAGRTPTVIHCCHPRAPLPLLRQVAPGAVALDVTDATPARWESLAVTLEAGIDVYAGCIPTAAAALPSTSARAVADGIQQAMERAGLGPQWFAALTATPTCGLVGLPPALARRAQVLGRDVARELTERGHE